MRTLLVVASLLLAVTALPAASAEADAELCKPVNKKIVQGVIVTVNESCDTQVDIDVQDCVWGGYWDKTEAGPLTVRVYKCAPPTEMSTTQTAGPCPSEHQLGVGTLYLGANCYAQLDIKFYDCIWGGHWEEYGNKVAKVRVYSCDPYPPASNLVA